MTFETSPLPGVLVFTPTVYTDDRGYFMESYSRQSFAESGIHAVWVQDNESRSRYGVIRGLHLQKEPHAQAKMVRAVTGTIWDVVVDLRPSSPTFKQWVGLELSDKNKKQVYVPRGCAHGFATLSETAVVVYKCDALYTPQAESGIRFDDPALGVDWKVPAPDRILSHKDLQLPLLV